MELLILDEGPTRLFQSLWVLNPPKLAGRIMESPSHYIFILSPSEWKQWSEIHHSTLGKLQSPKTKDEIRQIVFNLGERSLTDPCILISMLSGDSKIGNSHRIVCLGPLDGLRDCYAVFFAKNERPMERIEEVKRTILRFRKKQKKQLKKPLLSYE